MANINTKSYWDSRFSSGDWEQKDGRSQTIDFALSQISKFDIPKTFSGTILDFGCGLGDALQIYRKAWPESKLLGFDISIEAIKKCQQKYGKLGKFINGSSKDVPKVDIIIASNVFEHLTGYIAIAEELLTKCNTLYIIVPYKEIIHLNPDHEHVNSFTENSFNEISKNISFKIYKSRGWGEDGMNLYINVYLKNIIRIVFGRELRYKASQIMFKIQA